MGFGVLYMTVTFTNLSGTRENLDKTIRDLLQDNWTAGNTSSITPQFESDTEEPDGVARLDFTKSDVVRISLIAREYVGSDEDGDWNGDDKHLWKCTLAVEVQGQSLSILTLFEDEINRILWENRPNSATRLNKSDAAASEAGYFDKSEISFERIYPSPGETDYTPSSVAELVIYYYKIKT